MDCNCCFLLLIVLLQLFYVQQTEKLHSRAGNPCLNLDCRCTLHQVSTLIVTEGNIFIRLQQRFSTAALWFLTLSSPLATLNDSSTTLPAAMRDAVEVCDSFQMVSLSTCPSQQTYQHLDIHKKIKLYL